MWQAQNHQQKQLLWKRAQGWQMPHLALRETWKANLKIETAVVGWGTLVTTKQSQRSCKRPQWSREHPELTLRDEGFERTSVLMLSKVPSQNSLQRKHKALNPPPFEFQLISIKVCFPLLWMLSTEISFLRCCSVRGWLQPKSLPGWSQLCEEYPYQAELWFNQTGL